MLSQFIRFADPERVNSFYVVTHVGSFIPLDGNDDAYIRFDPNSGELSYSQEFEGHLRYWEDIMSQTIDPLVAEGYLQWTSLAQIGELFMQWEQACQGR
jgi:hypothetical protein